MDSITSRGIIQVGAHSAEDMLINHLIAIRYQMEEAGVKKANIYYSPSRPFWNYSAIAWSVEAPKEPTWIFHKELSLD